MSKDFPPQSCKEFSAVGGTTKASLPSQMSSNQQTGLSVKMTSTSSAGPSMMHKKAISF